MTADFSVVVPTYRRPEQLTRCLEGLSRLHFPRERFEVIVVDDGSPESHDTVVARWRGQLEIGLVVQQNAGPAAARNCGAARARRPFLAFIDDDCVPDPGWLRALSDVFDEAPEQLLGGCTVNALPANPFSSASQQLVSYLCDYYDGKNGRTRLFTSNNMALATQAFHAMGGFDARFRRAAGEDREFCDRWVAGGGGTRLVGDAIVLHTHQMNLQAFWRQHFEYGRGAAVFRKMRAARDGAPLRIEPMSFYMNLLRFPLNEGWTVHGARMTVLVALAQVANATGFLWSSVRPPMRAHPDSRTRSISS